MTDERRARREGSELAKSGGARAYTVVGHDGDFRIGLAVEGEPGYYQTKRNTSFKSYAEVAALVDAENRRLGLSPERAQEIVAGSRSRVQHDAERPVERPRGNS